MMKTTGIILTLALGLIVFSCNRNDNSKSKVEIQTLIKEALRWADSKESIELLPVLTDKENNVYIGVDLIKHESNLDKLRATGFFADEFIENYNRIILTIDRKLKNHESEKWLVGDLPPFVFASGSNPWCGCQDVPYDNPNPWDYLETEIVELNNESARAIWRWGGLDPNADSGWKEFSYKFRTVKENGKWKIAYLQEFDLDKIQ